MLPLLCRAVEDGYERSCGFSELLRGPIVSESKLELELVVDDEFRKPSFL